MKTAILFALVCALSSVACDITCFGECDDWDDDDCSEEHHGSAGHKNSAGSGSSDDASGGKSTGNDSGGSGNSSNSGGTTNSAGNAGTPPPVSCVEERDCPRGFNCDYERKECMPADAETCAELSTESVCDNRNDCMAIYAGINCSCGADCTCKGGEPGCVCESFQFFSCEPLKN